jgi:hypothetical protein
MDVRDHEHPPTIDTVATMPADPAADSPAAGEERATLSSASTDDADPTHESGYGFGV